MDSQEKEILMASMGEVNRENALKHLEEVIEACPVGGRILMKAENKKVPE
jgi:hypothetical protein